MPQQHPHRAHDRGEADDVGDEQPEARAAEDALIERIILFQLISAANSSLKNAFDASGYQMHSQDCRQTNMPLTNGVRDSVYSFHSSSRQAANGRQDFHISVDVCAWQQDFAAYLMQEEDAHKLGATPQHI